MGRFRASWGRTGGSCGMFSGILGRVRAPSKRLELDFHTKRRCSIWNAFFCASCLRFSLECSLIRTRAKALWYYKNNSFEPWREYYKKLHQDTIVEPTCPHIASQNAPKSCLGGVWKPPGTFWGASWSVLRASRRRADGALGCFGASKRLRNGSCGVKPPP